MADLKYYSVFDIENKRILGRTDLNGEMVPLFYNGSGVELNVTGSELWVDIKTDSSYYEPWVCTMINGAMMSRQMALPGEYSICLFRSMNPESIKNVRFLRELQAMSDDNLCWLCVKGFRTDGDFLPLEDKKYRLEFIGDSITTGEGTYGAKEDSEWLSMYMSFSAAYPCLVGDKLDAEVRCLSQGGWGIYCGWDHDLTHRIPDRYEKVCALGCDNAENIKLGADRNYDFDSWQPDAIILNLGTNDCSGLNLVKEPDGSFNRELDLFKNSSTEFLKLLRRDNPGAHLLWAFGMLGDELLPAIREVVENYSASTGDNNIAVLRLETDYERTVGAHGHPGVLAHRMAAEQISEYLQKILK